MEKTFQCPQGLEEAVPKRVNHSLRPLQNLLLFLAGLLYTFANTKFFTKLKLLR